MAYITYNEEELNHLLRLAKGGDDTALNMLRDENKRVAKAANTRLLRIERAGKVEESPAYQRATLYTNERNESNRFSGARMTSPDNLARNLREMRHFMSLETSTLRGIKYAKDRLFKSLEDYDIHIKPSDRDIFYNFIRTDALQDIMTITDEYDIIMDLVVSNLDRIKNDFEEVYRDFESYLTGHEKYDEFLIRMGRGIDIETLYQRQYDRRNIKHKQYRGV